VVKLTVRLPIQLHDRLRRGALESQRSLSARIVEALGRGLAEPEAGSGWTDALINARDQTERPLHLVALSEIGIVEVAAVVARRERMGELDAQLGSMLFSSLVRDCRSRFFAVAVRGDIIHRAGKLALQRALRAYDAVHLATALVLNHHLRAAAVAPLSFV